MKPSGDKWIKHRWPLIEMNMSRQDCYDWLDKHNYPKPEKSACVYCPYHNDKLWSDMKENDPVSFNEAVRIDHLIRNGVKGTTDKLYLHNSRIPLDEADFSDKHKDQINLFDDECTGMCGN